MLKRLAEGSVLFITVFKWVFLATIVGGIVGLSITFFLNILKWSDALCSGYAGYFLLLPIALFLSAFLIRYLAPDAEGHGTEKVIEAIHKASGKIKAAVIPVKLVTTVMTLALGGSAGKEGPCAQIGAGLSSLFANLLRFDDHDRKKLVICGISAGFASVFGTPIAGAIFGVEVLFVGSILYDVLLPSFIAGITAYQVSSALGITYFYSPIEFLPVFSEIFFLKVVLSGLFFGLCALLFIEIIQQGEKLSSKIKIWPPLKGLIGGVLLIGGTLLFSKQYLGLGLDTIEFALHGGDIAWYTFIVKSIFTSITLNFGGSGGIVTPIFFVGSTAGILYSKIMHLDPATFSAIGLVSVLAGTTNTPIAASIMAVELFGPEVAPYATVACVISYLITGHRSVYPSQILAVKKSASLDSQVGKELERLQTGVKPRKRSLLMFAIKIANKIENRTKKKIDQAP